MKKLHIAAVEDLLAAANAGGKDVAGLCGTIRFVTKKSLQKSKATGGPVCKKCERISKSLLVTGQATKVHGPLSVGEMQELVKPPAYTYAVKWTGKGWNS